MTSRWPRTSTHLVGLSLLVALVACGGGDPGVQIGPPSRIDVVGGADQAGIVGTPVPAPPTVRVADADGNGVAGIAVRFDIVSGGGILTGDSVVTGPTGLAALGEWRLGADPGTQQLRAQALGFPLQTFINATAGSGPPASIQAITGGSNLTAIVNEVVFPAPTVRVRDAFGNPIVGALVTFQVILGGGSVTDAQVVTDAEGSATVGSWRLGPVSGTNRLIARTSNGIVTTFTATAIGVPASAEPTSPQTQDGITEFAVPVLPRVVVRDQQGQPVSGVAVTFAITAGDGTLTGATAVTAADGIAAPTDWRLGSTGFHQLRATIAGFPGVDITFDASATPKPFTIDVRFAAPLTPNQRDTFVAAALRWMDVIVGDLPSQQVARSANSCFGGTTHPAVNELVDDIVIFAEVTSIDGPGTVLGQAGYCNQRGAGAGGLPSLGHMQFDIADLATFEATNRLDELILHEMGHVLGIGTLWSSKNVIQGAGGSDPIFTGTQANLVWPQLGVSYDGAIVPIENDFGGGTQDVHWRESILDREIMTGFIEASGVYMPLSVLTVASLSDLGYQVDLTQADPFTAPALRADGTLQLTPGGTRIRERIFTPEGMWMSDGKFIPGNQ